MAHLAGKQGNYEVGYGKPPVRTRFQKGKSGNPKGFPKGGEKLSFALKRLLAMPVEKFKRYKPRTRTEEMAMRLMLTAIYGKPRARLRAVKFITDRTEGKAVTKMPLDYL
jgi:hypothetical protein